MILKSLKISPPAGRGHTPALNPTPCRALCAIDERKRLDLIVANDISRKDSGFGTDDNAVVLLDRSGGQQVLPLLPKREVADRILDEALAIGQSRA